MDDLELPQDTEVGSFPQFFDELAQRRTRSLDQSVAPPVRATELEAAHAESIAIVL